MIVYKDLSDEQILYDTTMVSIILNISKSKMKREFQSYKFQADDYIIYNNRWLIKEECLIRFITHLAEKYITDTNE